MRSNKITYLSQKKELIGIDCCKLICAMLIVTIHMPMFGDVSSELAFWTDQILARIAVPFFFISSGYFVASKINDRQKIYSYCKRILTLYGIYTILYLQPIRQDLAQLNFDANGTQDTQAIIAYFIRKTLLIGSYIQLWYFVAIIVSVILLYLAVNQLKWSDRTLLVVATVCYIMGVLGNGYQSFFIDMPVIGTIMKSYYGIFETTRNGLFYGLLYVSIGYLCYKHRDRIKNKLRCYSILAIIAFLIMNVEAYMVRYVANHTTPDMILTTPLVTIFLFLTICFIQIPTKYQDLGVMMRTISVLLFGFHLLLYYYLKIILDTCGIHLNSLVVYTIIVLANSLLAMVLIKLQRVRGFGWVKYLY